MSGKAYITGANGFLGRHVTERLKAEGWAVSRAVRTAPVGGVPDGTLVLGTEPWTEVAMAKALDDANPDVVFHLAGNPWARPVAALYETNLLLAARLLDAVAARARPPAVVLIGSAAEYGFVAEDGQPVREDAICVPQNHHGIAKHAQTQLGLAWAQAGLPVLVARLFNPVGASMPAGLALPSFAAQIVAGARVLRVGDLDVARDFIDVAEAARLIVALASDSRNFGQVVNICSGTATVLRSLVDRMVQLADRQIDIVTDPARIRPGEMRTLRGDIRRLLAAGLPPVAPDFGLVLPALMRNLATRGTP